MACVVNDIVSAETSVFVFSVSEAPLLLTAAITKTFLPFNPELTVRVALDPEGTAVAATIAPPDVASASITV